MFDDDAAVDQTAETGAEAPNVDSFGGDDELPTSSVPVDSKTEQNSETNQPSEGGDRNYADEIYSTKIATKFRVFYIDLKESHNGKFVKISEKSRGGQRSTIMFDGEDIDAFIEAFSEIKAKI